MMSGPDKKAASQMRIELSLEHRPFTCALGFVAGMSLVASMVYLSVFTDGREEMRRHLAQCAVATGTAGLLFLFFFWHESHGPFPLRLRRLFWHAAVWCYGVIGAAIFTAIASSFIPITAGVRLLCSWAAVSPIPIAAGALLRRTRPPRFRLQRNP